MYKRKRKKDVTFELVEPNLVHIKGGDLPSSCTLDEYETLKKTVEHLDVDYIPLQVIQSLRIKKERVGNIPLEDTLFQYQREGVRRAIEFGGRALIGDEMGVGT